MKHLGLKIDDIVINEHGSVIYCKNNKYNNSNLPIDMTKIEQA